MLNKSTSSGELVLADSENFAEAHIELVLPRVELLAGRDQIHDVGSQRLVRDDQLARTARPHTVGRVPRRRRDVPAREQRLACVALERDVGLDPPPGERVRPGELEFMQERHVQLALVAEVEIRFREVVGRDQRRARIPAGVAFDGIAADIDDPVHRPAPEELESTTRALKPVWKPL